MSRLEISHPGFQPLYPKAGWRKDLRSKEKAMKRGRWFRGDQKDGNWKNMSKTDRRRRKTSRRLERWDRPVEQQTL